MKLRRSFGWVAASAMLLLVQAVHAATVSVSFDATPTLAFGPLKSAKIAFTYETKAESLFADAISAFDITILDKTYTLDEIGFTNFSTEIAFGGKLNDPSGIVGHTDDFMFVFNPSSRDIYGFGYTLASSYDLYSFVSPRIPANVIIQDVPEPGSLALMLIGLGFGANRVRRTRRLVTHSSV